MTDQQRAIAETLCERWFDTGARASWCPKMCEEFAAALAEAEQRGKESAGTRLDTVSAQWEYHVGIAEHIEWCRKVTP